ncbi:dTDP-4-dehydrorhamnose 3,5-epimerase [Hyphomonas adhaerens]|uniref:dTDP-4-dehydrorhamnose 3,5-epimerase n=1 Tax=Hyphomonas adhaerens TaxID=81029 RepID=UPI002355743E|nr:dTDP-4-dehydrorhamnose 3,5-epimerase [Hyphomonas adhaerens]
MAKFEKIGGLTGVLLIHPKRIGDERGFFAETFRQSEFASHGIDCQFVQSNHSLSRRKGTLRGLHFQKAPFGQAKLVKCIAGSILDVVVDIRPQSATFGQTMSVELSAETGNQLFVPDGFAHGFCTLEDDTQIAYDVSEYYTPEAEFGLAFDDPELGIHWPFPESEMTLSERDRHWPGLSALKSGAAMAGVK